MTVISHKGVLYMSFTLFSVTILLLTALFTVHGAVRGARRGVYKTTISLITILSSLISAIVVSPYISRNLAVFFAEFLGKDIGYGTSEYMNMLVSALLSMVISSVIFIVFFLLFRVIFALVFAIVRLVSARKAEKESNETKANMKAEQKYPLYKSNSSGRGAVIGAISGLLVTIIIMAPVMGTLSLAGDVINTLEKADKNMFSKNSAMQQEVESIRKYSNDAVGLALYYSGGRLIYSATASTTLSGQTVYAVNELESINALLEDFIAIAPVLQDPTKATDEHLEKIDDICSALEKSKLLTVILAEYLPKIASSWLAGEAFMEIKRPDLGGMIDPAFDSILTVCADTDIYTVKPNTVSLLRIYYILIESGILQAGNDINALLECIENSGLIDKLSTELDKNPNMKPVKEILSNLVMRAIIAQIFGENFSSETLSELAASLANDIDKILDGIYDSDDEMIADVTACAKEHLENYGISLPDSIVDPISQELVKEFKDGGEITPERLQEILMDYFQQ